MARSTKSLDVKIPKVERPDASRGGGAWSLKVDHVENWAWRTNVFTNDELDTIIRIGESIELTKASTLGKQSDEYRNSMVTFLFPNEITSWIFARLATAIAEMNQQFFQFDLTGLEQGLQFTRYEAPGEHYHWHVDRGFMTATRKLSMSLQLSDPKTYKGGDLELKFGKENVKVERQRGMATFFPSYTLHRVKPVTHGTRYSLVAWISGPPFK